LKLAVNERLTLRCIPDANIQVSKLVDLKAEIGMKLLHNSRKDCVWGDKRKGCCGPVASFSISCGVYLLKNEFYPGVSVLVKHLAL